MTMPRAPKRPDFGPTTQFDTVPASDVLLAGARVGGFRIVELLGRGDSGVVYLALDSSLQRQVAIKEYFPATLAQRDDGLRVVPRRSGDGAAAFEAGRREFVQRAKLFARFEHSALIRVQSHWEENGTAYYAMNFVPGPNLAGALKALPRAPDEAWLRAMLTPVLDAVDLLHAAQAWHGGISPEAIVVRGVGVPVLLASAPPSNDEKPLAPPGPWTDLRALASVLHAAVTGQAALGSAVPRVHRPLTGLPYDPRFLSGIDRALSVDPRQRLRSVAEFRRCLGWAPPVAAPATASASSAPAPARAAAPVLSAAAERALAPPVRPATRANGNGHGSGRAEPGFGDSRFQSRFDPPPLPVAPPRRTGTWLVLLCAASLAGAALYLSLRPRVPKPVPVPAVVLQPLAAPARPVPAEPDKAADDDTPEATPAAAATPPVPEPAAVVPLETPPAKPVEAPGAAGSAATAARPPAEAIVANATNPRAACGSRVNFALLYCMQAQCAKPQFAKHAQCDELRRAGEVQ